MTVSDEFQQVSVWSTKGDAISEVTALTADTRSFNGAKFKINSFFDNEANCFLDFTFPNKAKIATARQCIRPARKIQEFPSLRVLEIYAHITKHHRMHGKFAIVK